MAKATAPLLSFSASGQIAKTQVYSSWKGRPYVRRHVNPANPQTSEQTKTRSVFSWLQNVYKFMGPEMAAAWEAYAKGQVMTARNAFSKANLATLRPITTLAGLLASPGNLGGLPAASITVTGGSGTLTVAATAPTGTITGWTLLGVVLAGILDQDAHVDTDYATLEYFDNAGPYTHDFTGLAAGTYWGFAFLKWQRPDGAIAYSPSISDSDVVT